MIYFNPMDLERPHRSGVLAVMGSYACIWALAFVSGANLDTKGNVWDTLVCELAPFVCIQPKQVQAEPRREYNITKLIYCPACKVRKRDDRTCIEIDIDDELHTMGVDCQTWEQWDKWEDANFPKRADWVLTVYIGSLQMGRLIWHQPAFSKWR